MKYYQNINTLEIIGIENMRDVIKSPTNKSIQLGYKGYSYEVVYDMICPNKLLANGLTSFCVTHEYLQKNYKRINKKMALMVYPIFKQYNYNSLLLEAKNNSVDSLSIIKSQTF